MIISPHAHNVLFDHFPLVGYQPDVEALRPSIVARHGEQEWRAVVLTAEMHGHLGIYALLGVKMGLAALEHFALDENPLKILSYAGSHPPISCMNDGLQVATASTLGHGLIQLSTQGPAEAMALFRRGDKCLKIRLKPIYDQLLTESLSQLQESSGRSSSAYWKALREVALSWWKEWDRHQIFAIEQLDPKKDFE